MTEEFREEVVIVGMAGRFPGAASVAEFWANLRDGVESIRRLSADELAAAGVDPVRAASDDYVPAAAPLEHADAFDAASSAIRRGTPDHGPPAPRVPRVRVVRAGGRGL